MKKTPSQRSVLNKARLLARLTWSDNSIPINIDKKCVEISEALSARVRKSSAHHVKVVDGKPVEILTEGKLASLRKQYPKMVCKATITLED